MSRVALLAGLAAVASAACGGGQSGSAPATPPGRYVLHTCFVPRANERVVRFTDAAGEKITGVLLGTGTHPTGVVLSHMLGDSLCSWLPYGRRLAAQGRLVLAFDSGPSSLPAQIAAAAQELRHRGAERVVLAGASIGGTASLVAAAGLRPAPAAVISLSGPARFRSIDALRAVRRLDVPVLFVVGANDGSFTDGARELYEATRARVKRLEILPTYRHGTALLTADAEARTRRILTAFISKHGA